jgi:hypothetical protein
MAGQSDQIMVACRTSRRLGGLYPIKVILGSFGVKTSRRSAHGIVCEAAVFTNFHLQIDLINEEIIFSTLLLHGQLVSERSILAKFAKARSIPTTRSAAPESWQFAT